MVTVKKTEETEWGWIARVALSEDSFVYFTGFDRKNTGMRALVFAALNDQCGSCAVLERGAIPTEVACMGRPAIAAYLYSAHRKPIKVVAEQLDVTEETVKQYLSDFRHGRR